MAKRAPLASPLAGCSRSRTTGQRQWPAPHSTTLHPPIGPFSGTFTQKTLPPKHTKKKKQTGKPDLYFSAQPNDAYWFFIAVVRLLYLHLTSRSDAAACKNCETVNGTFLTGVFARACYLSRAAPRTAASLSWEGERGLSLPCCLHTIMQRKRELGTKQQNAIRGIEINAEESRGKYQQK